MEDPRSPAVETKNPPICGSAKEYFPALWTKCFDPSHDFIAEMSKVRK
jgi:hypothetical protein